MAFRLQPREDPGHGLRRGFLAELARVHALVTSPAASSPARRDETVHRVRKSLKKLRAMLRLLRHALGQTEYRRENLALRDVARPLSLVRDAKVFVGAIEGLARLGRKPAQVRRDLDAIAQRLATRHQALAEQVLGRERAFEPVAAALEGVRARVGTWELPTPHGWELLERGFGRAYRRGRRARGRARRRPTSPALHEWRKEGKYLLNELQLIQPAWSRHERLLAERLDRLGDLLGEDHDLAVVRTMVTEPQVRRLIDRRREMLQRRAFALGRLVYDPEPQVRLRALQDAWTHWRGRTATPHPLHEQVR